MSNNHQQKLGGKIAVITGGSSGIGLATAKRFVGECACVFQVSTLRRIRRGERNGAFERDARVGHRVADQRPVQKAEWSDAARKLTSEPLRGSQVWPDFAA